MYLRILANTTKRPAQDHVAQSVAIRSQAHDLISLSGCRCPATATQPLAKTNKPPHAQLSHTPAYSNLCIDGIHSTPAKQLRACECTTRAVHIDTCNQTPCAPPGHMQHASSNLLHSNRTPPATTAVQWMRVCWGILCHAAVLSGLVQIDNGTCAVIAESWGRVAVHLPKARQSVWHSLSLETAHDFGKQAPTN